MSEKEGWRKASEPPDTDREVLVMFNGVRRVGYHAYKNWVVYGAVTLLVTHWRELPEPPEGET